MPSIAIMLILDTFAASSRAIVEQLDGKAVDWMEKVSNEEYAAAISAAHAL